MKTKIAIKHFKIAALLLLLTQPGFGTETTFDECIASDGTPLKIGNAAARTMTVYYTDEDNQKEMLDVRNGYPFFCCKPGTQLEIKGTGCANTAISTPCGEYHKGQWGAGTITGASSYGCHDTYGLHWAPFHA